jgi:CRP-like cAMP-binding protein
MLISGNAQNIPLLKDLPYEVVQQSLTNSERLQIKKKQVVFEQGEIVEFFFISLTGLLKLSKKIDASIEIIHDIVGPNEIIAGLLMFGTADRYPVTLTAISNAELIAVPKNTYTQFWATNIKLLDKMQMQNQKRMLAMQELRNGLKFNVEKRMAWIVKYYLKKVNVSESIAELAMSRQDLSNLVGTTVESTIRVLSKWKKISIIENNEGKTLINISKLDEILNSADPS